MEMIKKPHRSLKKTDLMTKRSGGEKILFGVVFILFAIYGASLVFPFLFLFFSSLKTNLEYLNDLIAYQAFALPDSWVFANYLTAFQSMSVPHSVTGEMITFPIMIFNSLWYAVVRVVCEVLACSVMGYCLSKYRFKARGVIYAIGIFTMTIPIIGTTGAMFKLVFDLGVYNSPFYVIFASLSCFGFNFLIMYAFFSSIPWSYAEAVFMDGGGHFTVFFRIMLPQALPSMLALGIISFIGAWNDHLTVLLYLPDYPTISAGLYRMQTLIRKGDAPAYYASLMMSLIPVLILFGCFSDVIMKNMSVGGLKG